MISRTLLSRDESDSTSLVMRSSGGQRRRSGGAGVISLADHQSMRHGLVVPSFYSVLRNTRTWQVVLEPVDPHAHTIGSGNACRQARNYLALVHTPRIRTRQQTTFSLFFTRIMVLIIYISIASGIRRPRPPAILALLYG